MEQGFTSRADFSQCHSGGFWNMVIYTAGETPCVSVNVSEWEYIIQNMHEILSSEFLQMLKTSKYLHTEVNAVD